MKKQTIYHFSKLKKIIFIVFSFIALSGYSQTLDELDEALAELEADSVNEISGDGEVFYQPHKKPLPKTTMTSFYHSVNEYVKENYPEGVESYGRVYVEFIVEPDGKLTNFKVDDGLHSEVNQIVIEGVKSLGDWIPGENGVVKVRCYHKQPIMVDKDLIRKN